MYTLQVCHGSAVCRHYGQKWHQDCRALHATATYLPPGKAVQWVTCKDERREIEKRHSSFAPLQLRLRLASCRIPKSARVSRPVSEYVLKFYSPGPSHLAALWTGWHTSVQPWPWLHEGLHRMSVFSVTRTYRRRKNMISWNGEPGDRGARRHGDMRGWSIYTRLTTVEYALPLKQLTLPN